MTTSRRDSALGLLAALVPGERRRAPRDMMDPPRRIARWCALCGAPRNLGTRDCPGCRLLEEARGRLVAYLARDGVPEGGPLELARRAGVPLRAVGELMARRAQRTVRTSRKLVAPGRAPEGP